MKGTKIKKDSLEKRTLDFFFTNKVVAQLAFPLSMLSLLAGWYLFANQPVDLNPIINLTVAMLLVIASMFFIGICYKNGASTVDMGNELGSISRCEKDDIMVKKEGTTVCSSEKYYNERISRIKDC